MATDFHALVLRVELLERRYNSSEHVSIAHGASDTFWLLFCGALVNFMQVGTPANSPPGIPLTQGADPVSYQAPRSAQSAIVRYSITQMFTPEAAASSVASCESCTARATRASRANQRGRHLHA